MSHFDIYSSYSIFAPKYIPLVDLIVDFLARKFNYSLKVVKWDFLQGFSNTVKEEVSLPLKLNKSEKNPFALWDQVEDMVLQVRQSHNKWFNKWSFRKRHRKGEEEPRRSAANEASIISTETCPRGVDKEPRRERSYT